MIRTVSVLGIDSLIQQLNDRLGDGAVSDIDRITETYARKMAADAAAMAPIDSGALKTSIASSPEQVEEHVWQYGSNLPYATRQEYEHATNKAFIRKSVWNNRQRYRDAIKDRIMRG